MFDVCVHVCVCPCVFVRGWIPRSDGLNQLPEGATVKPFLVPQKGMRVLFDASILQSWLVVWKIAWELHVKHPKRDSTPLNIFALDQSGTCVLIWSAMNYNGASGYYCVCMCKAVLLKCYFSVEIIFHFKAYDLHLSVIFFVNRRAAWKLLEFKISTSFKSYKSI